MGEGEGDEEGGEGMEVDGKGGVDGKVDGGRGEGEGPKRKKVKVGK